MASTFPVCATVLQWGQILHTGVSEVARSNSLDPWAIGRVVASLAQHSGAISWSRETLAVIQIEGDASDAIMLRWHPASDDVPAMFRTLSGSGIPNPGYRVLGVDISSVQIERACQLVPEADFIQADMTSLNLAPAAFDAVVCLYALIHIPLADQPAVLHRIRRWLVDGGYLLAIVGHEAHEGVAPYHGAPMFWSHADIATSLDWMRQARLEPLCHHYVPEGDVGHDLVLAQAC